MSELMGLSHFHLKIEIQKKQYCKVNTTCFLFLVRKCINTFLLTSHISASRLNVHCKYMLQFIYYLQNQYVPGLLYFVCGILATLCTIGLMGLPETMDANLRDKIDTENVQNVNLRSKIDTEKEQNVRLSDKTDKGNEQNVNLIDKIDKEDEPKLIE